MRDWQPASYKDYRWIVADPDLLGGKLAVRGTRLSVALIFECLSNGMTLEDIDDSFNRLFPHAALAEVFKVASELSENSLFANSRMSIEQGAFKSKTTVTVWRGLYLSSQ